MAYSKYLRKNLVHSYDFYDLDRDDDMSTTPKASRMHSNVHDPHVEVNNPQTDEDEDVGVCLNDYQTQKESDMVTKEDFKVNIGGYREADERPLRRYAADFADTISTEDDDE